MCAGAHLRSTTTHPALQETATDMDLTHFPMGAHLTELDGRAILPPLIRTPHGWVEQQPVGCGSCEGTRFLIGWTACGCRTDALAPGHRTWTCRQCGQHERVGCLDETAQRGPMEEYGCAN